MYDVAGQSFESFSKAVDAAKVIDAEVYEVRADGERIRRWAPIPKKAPKTRHVIVNADGSTTEFGKVRR